jgi:hypothetical protein
VSREIDSSGVALVRAWQQLSEMDPILRTGLDWFVEETRASGELAHFHQALADLRVRIDKLPSNLFFLESPDEAYTLEDILMVMGKQALAWQLDGERVIERKLLAPQVEEILEKALHLRELLDAMWQSTRRQVVRRLPPSLIRQTMETRGEPLPDRL